MEYHGMLTRFLIWIFLWIQRLTSNSNSGAVIRDIPETLQRLEKIKATIDTTPSNIKEIDRFDDFLFNRMESKFKDVGHIFNALDVFHRALGEQILDPSVSKPIEDDRIELGKIGNKTVMLAYFQTQNGRDITLRETYPLIQKYVSDLIQLYTLLNYHPDIDEEYLPYLDRRINPLLRELERYTETIKTLGTSTHV